MDYVIGIDCGATHLRVGLVTKEGKLLAHQITNSPLKSSPQDFGQIVAEIITELSKGANLELKRAVNIGVGVPGPLDLETGQILSSANLGNLQPIEIKHQLVAQGYTNIYIDRDTNVALLGEAWQGAAVGVSDVVMLTLGTGVGGAMMVKGEIDRGSQGQAGELGHIYLEMANDKWQMADLPKCGLGHSGCFEALLTHTTDTNEFSRILGYGLASIVDIFNPEMIVVGGGRVGHGADFLPEAMKIMTKVGMKPLVDGVKVVYAKLEDKSGIYGAARLALVKP